MSNEENLSLSRLLIIGPSFRRNKASGLLSAIERYDGIFFRVTRKQLSIVSNVDVLVMRDDLILVNANTPLPYTPHKGENWRVQTIDNEIVEKARKRNDKTLKKKLTKHQYSEVFVAMGKRHAKSLPDLSQYNIKIVFPTSGGAGIKARALKNWLRTTFEVKDK